MSADFRRALRACRPHRRSCPASCSRSAVRPGGRPSRRRSSSSSRRCSRPRTPGPSSRPAFGARWWRPTRWSAGSPRWPPAGSAIPRPPRSWSRCSPTPIPPCGSPPRSRMGLLRDTAGAQPLMDRITGLPALDGPTAQEAITALAKIGGPRVGSFFGGVLGGSVVPSREDRRPLLSQIVLESWRLGPDAPVVALLPFLEDTAAGFRWRAAYTLGRVRARAAANRLTAAAARPRAHRARAWRRAALTRELRRFGRPRAQHRRGAARPRGVRSRACRCGSMPCARWRASATPRWRPQIVPLLDDPQPNVQVQAAMTAGELGGAEAARRARAHRGGEGALRRAAGGAGGAGPGRQRRLRRRRGQMAGKRRLAGAGRRGGGHGHRRSGAASLVPVGPGSAGRRRGPPGLGRRGRGSGSGAARRGPPAARPADAAVRSVAADAVARAADAGRPRRRWSRPSGERRATPSPMRRSRRSARSWPSGAPRPRPQSAGGPGVRRLGAAARGLPASGGGRRRTGPSWRRRWGPAYPIATGRSAAGLPRPRRAATCSPRIPWRGRR